MSRPVIENLLPCGNAVSNHSVHYNAQACRHAFSMFASLTPPPSATLSLLPCESLPLFGQNGNKSYLSAKPYSNNVFIIIPHRKNSNHINCYFSPLSALSSAAKRLQHAQSRAHPPIRPAFTPVRTEQLRLAAGTMAADLYLLR